jgi:hypothetical protein
MTDSKHNGTLALKWRLFGGAIVGLLVYLPAFLWRLWDPWVHFDYGDGTSAAIYHYDPSVDWLGFSVCIVIGAVSGVVTWRWLPARLADGTGWPIEAVARLLAGGIVGAVLGLGYGLLTEEFSAVAFFVFIPACMIAGLILNEHFFSTIEGWFENMGD